jgi:hypothetical protein
MSDADAPPYIHLANVQQVFGTDNCFTVDPIRWLSGYDFGDQTKEGKISTLINQLFHHHANNLPPVDTMRPNSVAEAYFLFRPGKYVRNAVIVTFTTKYVGLWNGEKIYYQTTVEFGGQSPTSLSVNAWEGDEKGRIDPEYKFKCFDYQYLSILLVVQEHRKPEVYLGSWEKLQKFPEPINQPILSALLWNMMEANHAIHSAKKHLEDTTQTLWRESGARLEISEARHK